MSACRSARFFFGTRGERRPTFVDDAGIEAGIECTASDRTIARTANRSSRRDRRSSPDSAVEIDAIHLHVELIARNRARWEQRGDRGVTNVIGERRHPVDFPKFRSQAEIEVKLNH